MLVGFFADGVSWRGLCLATALDSDEISEHVGSFIAGSGHSRSICTVAAILSGDLSHTVFSLHDTNSAC